MTMAKRGEKSVPLKGLSDKQNITLTFAVTFTGDFLPMQIIYGSKTDRSQPRRLSSQKGSMSPKMKSIGPMKPKPSTLSNKSLILTSLINEKNWDCLLILTWDVFRGQTTDHVAQILDSLNIKVVKVPANMTHFFQPLDLTVNGSAKNFMRKSL